MQHPQLHNFRHIELNYAQVWLHPTLQSRQHTRHSLFLIWKNNDLWNLLPPDAKTNNQKRDKIPCVELIEKRKDLIFHYWELLNINQQQRFQKEIKITLLGNNTFSNWKQTAIEHLQRSCDYLISINQAVKQCHMFIFI